MAKNKGGRPTKYTSAIVTTAEDYIEGYAEQYGHLIPSVIGLAEVLDVTPKTLYNWSHDESRPEFLHILERINARQHRMLLENGLTGEFNAAITKLALGKHGYSDKTENEHTGKDGGAIALSNITFNPVGNE